MSVVMMAKVWQLDLEPTPKLVLLRLADFVNQEGRTAWPSVERIAYECCIDRRTVQRQLRRLEELGLIEAMTPATRYRSIVYALYPERGDKLPPLHDVTGAASDPDHGRRSAAAGAADDPSEGGTAPPKPEGTAKRSGKRTGEPLTPLQSQRGTRALNGSNRRRDRDALVTRIEDLPIIADCAKFDGTDCVRQLLTMSRLWCVECLQSGALDRVQVRGAS